MHRKGKLPTNKGKMKMTNFEKAIAIKEAAEAAFASSPSQENLSKFNRADEAWQVARYEAGEAWERA